MTGEVITLDDFRKKSEGDPMDQPMNWRDQDIFADDIVADQMANELVHGLMVDFQSRGADLSDGKYQKHMEALADVARMMTHRHFDVVDMTNLLLDQTPDSALIVVVADDEDELNG